MAIFEVTGGKQLKGEIIPQGAKNEALQILCAVLLTSEKVVISNIPDIVDINKLIDLLSDLGVKVEKTGHEEYTFQADNVNVDYLVSEEFKKKGSGLRGSTMIIGPMLARFGRAYMPKPGGDKIGRRRMDTHFIGFENLGAKFEYDHETENFKVSATKLIGACGAVTRSKGSNLTPSDRIGGAAAALAHIRNNRKELNSIKVPIDDLELKLNNLWHL